MADDRLGKDIQKNLPRLFRERSAEVAPNDASEYSAPRAFDHAVATIGTPELDLRFTRAGGELSLETAAPGQRSWSAAAESPAWTFGRDWNSLDWAAIDGFLAEHWDRMKAAL